MRLAMSILVRDEADVIEANIRHHAHLGVSKFIVTDNSSTDGTREILDTLSSEFDLQIIDEPSLTIDQDLWVSRMANNLKDNDAADWVINNDADEFWIPKNNSPIPNTIAAELESSAFSAHEIGILYCPRHNILPSKEQTENDSYRFSDNAYKVFKDWMGAVEELKLPETTAAVLNQGQHVVIRTLPGKVITRLQGLEAIDMGNHGAKHQLKKIEIDSIEIAHYPVRDFSQFKSKVVNYGSSIENNERLGAGISLHLRRWYESHKRGLLRDEYDAIVLPEVILEKLVRMLHKQ